MTENSDNKFLICVRHAKSAWDDPNLSDKQRPLNKRGLRNAPMMGKRLKQQPFRPDLLVSSPARRALMTAQAIAKEIDYPLANIIAEEELYFCGVGAQLKILQGLDDCYGCVIWVSHNPDISGLVADLTGAEIMDLPTCAMVYLNLGVRDWTAVDYRLAELVELDYPKKER